MSGLTGRRESTFGIHERSFRGKIWVGYLGPWMAVKSIRFQDGEQLGVLSAAGGGNRLLGLEKVRRLLREYFAKPS
jgi:hypothetical protein